MLSELQGKMVKIRQREDDEYEKEYLKEQRILFKKLFKKYPKIKEIIEYNDSVDLFRLSLGYVLSRLTLINSAYFLESENTSTTPNFVSFLFNII